MCVYAPPSIAILVYTGLSSESYSVTQVSCKFLECIWNRTQRRLLYRLAPVDSAVVCGLWTQASLLPKLKWRAPVTKLTAQRRAAVLAPRMEHADRSG